MFPSKSSSVSSSPYAYYSLKFRQLCSQPLVRCFLVCAFVVLVVIAGLMIDAALDRTRCFGPWTLPNHCTPEEHWRNFADRRWMLGVMYPALKRYLLSLSSPPALLDIGYQPYNKVTIEQMKDLSSQHPRGVEHWFIDIHQEDIPKDINYMYARSGMLEASTRFPQKRNYFDIIVSMGVLGHVDRHNEWDDEDIQAYLQSVYDFLKPQGIFIFHIETWGTEEQTQARLEKYSSRIAHKFKPCTLPLSSLAHHEIVPDSAAKHQTNNYYHFYTYCKINH